MVTVFETLHGHLSREETGFVKFAAILLITNSHLDHLYPVPVIATGGAIGNALFFMFSGYGLAVSEQQQKRSFISWCWRRITRIYPSVFIVTMIDALLSGYWNKWQAPDYLLAFIWPTSFWFIGALVVFYPLIFGALRLANPKVFIGGIALLMLPYFYCYFSFIDLTKYTIEGPSYFKWLFYLQMMFFGGYLACSDIRIPQGKARHFFYLCSALLGYLAVIMAVKAGFGKIQVLIHILTFPIIFFTLCVARSAFVARNILGKKVVLFFVSLVAGLTLEIYLLQYMVYSSHVVTELPFPVNLAMFLGIVLLLALIVSSAAAFIRQLLRQDRPAAVHTD